MSDSYHLSATRRPAAKLGRRESLRWGLLVATSTCLARRGRAEEKSASRPAPVRANAAAPPQSVFPGATWREVDPDGGELASMGWNAGRLGEAVDYAMRQASSGIVVVHFGRIVAEKHQPLAEARPAYRASVRGESDDGEVIEDVASVQKSVASILLGIAIDRGFVDLAEPVERYLSRGWSRARPDQERQITVRHLVSMTSGLDDGLSFVAPAGTKWRYNTTAYARVMSVIATAAKLDENALSRRWLLDPLGMRDSRWHKRQRPAFRERQKALGRSPKPLSNQLGFATTARDLARFGLLVLHEGRWNDEPLVSAEYVRESLQSSQALNPAYGYLWWLNGKPHSRSPAGGRRRGSLIPAAPNDLVAARGAMGRKVFVVPSMDLVVTRTGDQPAAEFEQVLWKKLMAARIA